MALVASTMIGGGRAKNRDKNDFYATEEEATYALLPFIVNWPPPIWEPFCGDGAIAKVFERQNKKVIASDIIDRGYGSSPLDFFDFSICQSPVLISNPPFKEAKRIILHAEKIGVKYLALLLKMTFWNAKTRRSLFYDWPPSQILPLTWRLDFTGQGRPLMDCMWCLWEPEKKMTGVNLLEKPVLLKAKDLF